MALPPSKEDRFRSLSAAVRAGAQVHPLGPPPEPFIGGRQGRSALVAAWLAHFDVPPGPEADVSRGYTTAGLAGLFPELIDDSGKRIGPGCPAGPTGTCPHPDVGLSLEQKIIHLEDRHRFTLEQVANWLQAYGY